MTLEHRQTERIAIAAIGVIAIGAAIPPYLKLTAAIAAHGAGVSWVGHVGLFILLAGLGVLGLLAVYAGLMFVAWGAASLVATCKRIIKRMSRASFAIPGMSRL